MQGARLMVIFVLTVPLNDISSLRIDFAEIWDEATLQRCRRQDDLMFDVDKKWSKELVEGRGMKVQDIQRLSFKYIMGLYQRLNLGLDLRQATGHGRLNDGAVNGDTIRAFPTKINTRKLRRREVSLAFNFTAILNTGAVQLAELRLRPTRHLKNVGFYRISAILQEGSKTKISRKFLVKTYMDDITGFFCLNLTSVVLQWKRHAKHNTTLEITLLRPKRSGRRREKRSKDQDGKQEVTSVKEQTYVDNDEAILLVVSEEGKLFKSQFTAAFRDATTSKKLKRAAKRKRKSRSKWKRAKKQKKQCANYEFEIDFNTLGWGEWIIEPKVFNAKFCYGECSLPIKRTYNPTNHAMMQGLMMSKGTDKLGSPCCVPSKLTPLSMLYYEDKAIVVRHHEQMVVSECGCA